MTKSEKTIELRTAAKCKVAEIETKIAFAHSEAAGKRASLMRERADRLEGLEAGSAERFDVLAEFRALLAGVNEQLTATVAQLKFEIQQVKAECERNCAAADDDPEPDEPQEREQPTQWLNGEQWTCAVVARRILNKLPKLNYPKESIYIEISPSYFGGCGLGLRYINTIDKTRGVTSCELLAKDEPEEQAQKIDLWLKDVEVQMARAEEIMREEADNE